MTLNQSFIHKQSKLVKGQNGSFTLEASMVFPVVFILILTLIFTSIFIYQKVVLYYLASDLAETTAFNWDNSYKDNIGAFPVGEYDDLYWRLTADRTLDFILGGAGNNSSLNITFGSQIDETSPAAKSADQLTLPEQKLLKAVSNIPQGISGSISYHNVLIQKKITVKLNSPLKIPIFAKRLLGNEITVEASAIIADPVEFIRTVELIKKVANIANKELINSDLLNKKNVKGKGK